MSQRTDNAATSTRRGGRPTREDAEQLRRTILDVATALIFEHGYGATSIDAIALQARVAKRTFYHRFRDKADLFAAVVHDVVEHLRPPGIADAASLGTLFAGLDLEEILLRFARIILRAALSPQALALNRVIISEAERFPELAAVVDGEGARQQAVDLISGLLNRERDAGRVTLAHPSFAAEQFLQMTVSLPQRRAMGLGTPMSEIELDGWVRDTVRLFLDGCRGQRREPIYG